MTLVLRSA